MKTIDRAYASLFANIKNNGEYFEGRNGGTMAIVGEAIKIQWNSENVFPIIAFRRQNIKHYLNEFLWEINGGNNVNDLNNVYAPVDSRFLWNNWANEKGLIPYSYGACWRANGEFNHLENSFDQLEIVEKQLKENPESRRITLVTADVLKNIYVERQIFEKMGYPAQVPPCHPLTQFSVSKGRLNAIVTSRSQDIVCGLPGDMIRYSLMVMCLAQISKLKPGKISIVFSNVHYYKNHEDAMLDIMSQMLKDNNAPYMLIKDSGQDTLRDFTYNDFNLYGYNPNKFVSMPLIP